jgi:hypothetical protein
MYLQYVGARFCNLLLCKKKQIFYDFISIFGHRAEPCDVSGSCMSPTLSIAILDTTQMALQQPNYAALAQHLAGVVQEVQLIPNAPIANMANIPNQLLQIQQQLTQTQQQLTQMQQQLNRVEGKLNEL